MTETPKGRTLEFQILRYNPQEPGAKPRMQAYELEEADGMTVFIALNEIREHRRPGGPVIQAGSASAGCNRQGD